MRKAYFKRSLAGILAASVIIGTGGPVVEAGAIAGATAAMLGTETSGIVVNTPLSGINLALSRVLEDVLNEEWDDSEDESKFNPEIQVAPLPEIDYANSVVANVSDYVNVRSGPGEDNEALGKLYKDCVGELLGQENGWVHIKSGSVDGWVKGEFVKIADKEMIDAVAKYRVTIKTDALRIRSGTTTDSSILDVAYEGEKLDIIDDSVYGIGWVGVKKGDTEGYVSAEYVEIAHEFDRAESKEEEAARLERERQIREQALSSMGMKVANYGLQFVGNPYVWGGTSLTRGADCSGFVLSVYAKFGVSLPHSSAADRHVGYAVPIDQSQMRPGDIVCYSGHVAIYIGGGQIVHAASRRSGIKVSNAFYRKVLAVRRIF